MLGAFNEIANRSTLHLADELSLPDRKAIDDAVVESLGIADASARSELISGLYAELKRFYVEARELDLRAQANRRMTSRRDKASPRTIAEEIWEEFDNLSGHFKTGQR